MKPVVLFLTIESPFPALSGGTLNSLKILEFLKEKYEVKVVCLERKNTASISEIIKKYPEIKVYSVGQNSERNIKNYALSLLNGFPFYVYRFFSKKLKSEIKNLALSADLILVDHLAMFSYVEEINHSNIILHTHNCESSLWEKYAIRQSNFLLKIFLKYEIERLRKFELKALKSCRLLLGSSNDLDSFRKFGVENFKMREVIHPGDERFLNSKIQNFDSTHGVIFYFGTLSWLPNEDGLIWFLKSVWPLIKREIPNLKMRIGGKGASEVLQKTVHESTDVSLIGFIENLQEEFSKVDLVVVPQRFGSGMKTKVLTALSAGLPLVVSPEAVSGLEVKDGLHCFIAENEEIFCKAVVQLFHSKETKIQFSEMGRKLILDKYTFNIYWEKLSTEFIIVRSLNIFP